MCLVTFPCNCQSYGMSFSVYNDVYLSSDQLSLIGVGNASDNSWGCSHSQYQTTEVLLSPSGRRSSTQSSGLSATTSLAIAGEYGDYSLGTTGRYYCSCSTRYGGYGDGEAFTLSLAISFFTDAIPYGLGCYYRQLACTPGTTATCGAGWAISSFSFSNCPTFARAGFLVIHYLGAKFCTVGLAAPAAGPGPCN